MRKILHKLKNGELTAEEAEKMLKTLQISELEDFVKTGIYSKFQTGFPEPVYAEGKDDQEIVKIILSCVDSGRIMVTMLQKERYNSLKHYFTPLIDKGFKIEYNKIAKILLVRNIEVKKIGKIGIITAESSNMAVAEEARITAEESGCIVVCSYDVGKTGIPGIFSLLREMLKNNVEVIIVIAGKEGSLLSVVAGLVDVPVIGVPTSMGSDMGKDGFTALSAMLFSSLGTAVVNIDNGFGAAIFASTIIKSKHKFES